MKEIAKITYLPAAATKIIVKARSDIKIQKITSFRDMLAAGVDFNNLKRAVLIGDCLLTEGKWNSMIILWLFFFLMFISDRSRDFDRGLANYFVFSSLREIRYKKKWEGRMTAV